MYLLELVLYTFLLFALINIILVPLGHILTIQILPNQSDRIQLAASFTPALLVYSGILVVLVFLGLSNIVIAWVLDVVIIGALIYWLAKGLQKKLFNRECLFIFLVTFLYLILSQVVSAFPELNLRDVSPSQTQLLTGLPVDNLIPYNIARLLTNRISPNLREIVPEWRASDRGPLAGIFTAVVFIILGIEDRGGWLSPSPNISFCYQTLMSFLNLLSLVGVWFVAIELFGKRAAVFSLLVLITTYFYFLNIIFSWPKFLMGYFILVSVFLYQKREKPIIVGAFCGAAMLAHDSAIFVTAVIFAYEGIISVWKIWKPKIKFNELFKKAKPFISWASTFVCGYLLITGPWNLFKIFISPPSAYLLYMHLFCDIEKETINLPFLAALKYYLEHNSITEIISTRVQNIFYPFSLLPAKEVFALSGYDIFKWFNLSASLVFFQFVWGVGLPIFLLLIIGVVLLVKQRKIQQYLPLLIAAFASMALAGLSFGCKNGSINHVCAYPAFLVTAVLVGWVIDNFGLWASVICAGGIAYNAITAVLFIYYHPLFLRPFFHGSSLYAWSQVAVITLLSLTFLCSFRLLRIGEDN